MKIIAKPTEKEVIYTNLGSLWNAIMKILKKGEEKNNANVPTSVNH